MCRGQKNKEWKTRARTISSGPRMANCRWSTRLQGIEEAEPKPDWYSMVSRGYSGGAEVEEESWFCALLNLENRFTSVRN